MGYNPARILMAVTDSRLRSRLRTALWRSGLESLELAADDVAIASPGIEPPDVLVLDHRGAAFEQGMTLIQACRRRFPGMPVVLIAAHTSEAQIAAALRAGVNDYAREPIVIDDLVARIQAQIPRQRESSASSPAGIGAPHEVLLGASAAIREVRLFAVQVARTDSNVLITGETGTGKELVAEMIHGRSARRAKALICVNCAAIPESLLESELFGYERGAFTGAFSRTLGLLQHANAGTLFFDEVGEMSRLAQAKLLRVIEERSVRRLGAGAVVPVDVRFIAATNCDLETMVAEGRFRKDLFYRLKVACIDLPPLRQRREDVPVLLQHFIAEMNRRYSRGVEGFTENALSRLIEYDWPGNVRELRNAVEAMFVWNVPDRIDVAHVSRVICPRGPAGLKGQYAESERLRSALQATQWNVSRTAKALHWSRMTLYRKMAKYQISRPGLALSSDPGLLPDPSAVTSAATK